jgi:uroporphyrin-III C-methyltransferase
MPQAEINRLLVERVKAGKQVVRLKGGDPFVFGRGGEEILALAEAGLPFEVVPGITSALAAPAYAGIPVTHRGMVTSFAVVTGHEDAAKPEYTTDWAALAQVPTLILLMAAKNIGHIQAELLQAGRSPETPAIAISQATTDRQRTARATLATLPEAIAAQQLPTPMVIVLGEVVTLHDQLHWFQPDGQTAGFVPYPAEEAHLG